MDLTFKGEMFELEVGGTIDLESKNETMAISKMARFMCFLSYSCL